jgi:tetratricopeptide (TPR) repeat protein
VNLFLAVLGVGHYGIIKLTKKEKMIQALNGTIPALIYSIAAWVSIAGYLNIVLVMAVFFFLWIIVIKFLPYINDRKEVNLLNEYNKLRASVGMTPAKDGNYFEEVAFMVVFYVLAPDELITEECKRLPVEERDLFMLVYATYLIWLSMTAVKSKLPPDSWRYISPLIKREFAKQSWYKEEIMKKIFNSMVKYPMGEGKGHYFNVPTLPWFDAVMATNLAGYQLSHSTNPEFTLYSAAISINLLKRIDNCAPTGVKQWGAVRRDERALEATIFSLPVSINEVLNIGDKLLTGEIRSQNVADNIEDEKGFIEEHEHKERILKLIARIKLFNDRNTDLRDKLKSNTLSSEQRELLSAELEKNTKYIVTLCGKIHFNKKQIHRFISRTRDFAREEEIPENIIAQYEEETGLTRTQKIEEDYEALLEKGIAYYNIGQYQRAIEEYNKAILLEPNNAVTFYRRGLAYAKLGQYQYAIDDYNEAIRLNPNYADALYKRLDAYEKLKKNQKID